MSYFTRFVLSSCFWLYLNTNQIWIVFLVQIHTLMARRTWWWFISNFSAIFRESVTTPNGAYIIKSSVIIDSCFLTEKNYLCTNLLPVKNGNDIQQIQWWKVSDIKRRKFDIQTPGSTQWRRHTENEDEMEKGGADTGDKIVYQYIGSLFGLEKV